MAAAAEIVEFEACEAVPLTSAACAGGSRIARPHSTALPHVLSGAGARGRDGCLHDVAA